MTIEGQADYIQSLRDSVRDLEKQHRAALRFPWKKGDSTKIAFKLTHRWIVIAANEYAIRSSAVAEALSSAFDHYVEAREGAKGGATLGYLDVQAFGAALLSSRHDEARKFAAHIASLAVLTRPLHATASDAAGALCGQHAAKALIEWLARTPESPQQQVDVCREDIESRWEQFVRWVDIASATTKGDGDLFATSAHGLKKWYDHEVKRGEFFNTEDRHLYLPGSLIAITAHRDGLRMPFDDERWPQKM